MTLEGEITAVKLLDVVDTREIAPGSCPMLETVIVVLELDPGEPFTVEGLTVIEKSPTLTVTLADRVNVPFEAIKVTV